MDEFKNPAPAPAESDDWRAQCESLQQLVVMALVLLLVVSGTMTIYLLRQWKFASKDLETLKEQTAPGMANFSKLNGPMNQFVSELIEFSKQHPDFAPILARDGIRPSASSASTPPGTQKK